MTEGPADPFTSMAESAAQMHEIWQAWVTAGFTADQALYLLGCVIAAPLRPPSQP